jgi:protein-disulfide isomerase
VTSTIVSRFVLCVVCLAIFADGRTGAQEPPATGGEIDRRVENIERTQQTVFVELGALKKELGELRTELMDIASRAGGKTAPLPKTKVSLQGAPTKGNPAATVAVIEFADFQCPYCAAFFRITLPAIEDAYIDSGKVLFAFRHLPLVEIHPRALPAARAASCAGDQGRFWEYHNRLFTDPTALDDETLMAYAAALGLDRGRFGKCLGGSDSASRIQQEASAAAVILVAAGTPTFLVGRLNSDGSVAVSDRIDGMREFEVFRRVIDGLLEATGQ